MVELGLNLKGLNVKLTLVLGLLFEFDLGNGFLNFICCLNLLTMKYIYFSHKALIKNLFPLITKIRGSIINFNARSENNGCQP